MYVIVLVIVRMMGKRMGGQLNQIYNLGDVDRMYLEACGLISIYRRSEPAPGLPLFPPGDEAIEGFPARHDR